MTAPIPPPLAPSPLAAAAPTTSSDGKIEPTELDILCGKTKQIISHPGTIRYQRVVDSYTQRYIAADTKYGKMQVTKALYDYLRTTSRFLKFNDKEKAWEEITPLAARDKIGHALRFAVNNLNGDKKRRKTKRGHRRVGSDFSAASLASLASEVSVNSTASSVGVNSLANALASSSMISSSNHTRGQPQRPRQPSPPSRPRQSSPTHPLAAAGIGADSGNGAANNKGRNGNHISKTSSESNLAAIFDSGFDFASFMDQEPLPFPGLEEQKQQPQHPLRGPPQHHPLLQEPQPHPLHRDPHPLHRDPHPLQRHPLHQPPRPPRRERPPRHHNNHHRARSLQIQSTPLSSLFEDHEPIPLSSLNESTNFDFPSMVNIPDLGATGSSSGAAQQQEDADDALGLDDPIDELLSMMNQPIYEFDVGQNEDDL